MGLTVAVLRRVAPAAAVGAEPGSARSDRSGRAAA
jgi:hypothetical protein